MTQPIIRAVAGSTMYDFPTPGVRFEVQLGETCTLSMLPGHVLSTIERRAEPAEATIDGLTVTPVAPGLHHYIVSTTAGHRFDLFLFAFDENCFDMIHAMRTGRSRSTPLSLAERRVVIRSICNHADFFDGTKQSLANKPLQLFGA